MGRNFWLIGIGGMLVAMSISAGCDQPRRPPQELELATLPYLQQTHHSELRAELGRLLADQATPLQLQPADAGRLPHGATEVRLGNGVRELNGIVDPQSLRLTLGRLSRFYPDQGLRLNGIDLQKGRELRRQFSQQLAGYRAVFNRADFQFPISLCDGLMADLTALDHAQFAHRLEGLEAAEILAAHAPETALLPLRNMLRIDSRLGMVKHVTARLTAARLRGEALQVVAAIVQHRACTPALHRELLSILESQLELWPPDADAWIGDRALGLHAYEMVRDGQLLNILTPKEIETLSEAGDLRAFGDAVMMTLDEDEWFYLSTMRRLVNACVEPYYERAGLLGEINDQAEALRDTPRYPLFATRVLLSNLGSGQREQALDRARCEAWTIALKEVTGSPVKPMWINPLTGRPYQRLRDGEKIEVGDVDSDEDESPIVVPL